MNHTATKMPGTAHARAPAPDRTDPRSAHTGRSDRLFDLSLAGRCIPAGGAGEPIAGDFYDAYALDQQRVLITIGDVAGHGFGAASRMRHLRTSVRQLAQQSSSLGELLSDLDEIYRRGDDDDIATVWLGVYDKDSNLLRYAGAGHPPPILAKLGGRPRLLAPASAPPLGTGAVAAHVQVHRVHWEAGALLVAYSDGLVERPELDLEDQLHRLRALVGRTHKSSVNDAHVVADTLLTALVPDPGSARDDVCILVLRRDDVRPDRRSTLTLAADEGRRGQR